MSVTSLKQPTDSSVCRQTRLTDLHHLGYTSAYGYKFECIRLIHSRLTLHPDALWIDFPPFFFLHLCRYAIYVAGSAGGLAGTAASVIAAVSKRHQRLFVLLMWHKLFVQRHCNVMCVLDSFIRVSWTQPLPSTIANQHPKQLPRRRLVLPPQTQTLVPRWVVASECSSSWTELPSCRPLATKSPQGHQQVLHLSLRMSALPTLQGQLRGCSGTSA